jgi:hypothetical protein
MSPHKQAFTPSKSSIPPCVGCEKCGDTKEGTLYSLQHGGHYLCTKCFFATPPGSSWPTPKAAMVEDLWSLLEVLPEERVHAGKHAARVETEYRERGKKRGKTDFPTSFSEGKIHRALEIISEMVMARKTGGKRMNPVEDRGAVQKGKTDGLVDIRLPDGRGLGVKVRRDSGRRFDMAETAGTKVITWDACVLLVLGKDGKLRMQGWHHNKKLARPIRFSNGKQRLGIQADDLLHPRELEEWLKK